MVSFGYLAADLVMAASCVEGAFAQEPSRSEASANCPIQREAKIGGYQLHVWNCVPDHRIPVPDVPLEMINPSPPRR
jgi:hypothetical protein